MNPLRLFGMAFGDLTTIAGFGNGITAQAPHAATVEIDPATKTMQASWAIDRCAIVMHANPHRRINTGTLLTRSNVVIVLFIKKLCSREWR